MSCCSKPVESASASSSSCCASSCCPGEMIARAGKCLGPLLLRLTLAGFMFPFGAGKVLGIWGGYGWSGTYNHFTQNMHIPAPFAVAAILTEFVAPILLVLGLLTRPAALFLVILMVVAAVLGGHVANGFFGNIVDGKHMNDGFALHLLYVGAALSLFFTGPGKISIDRFICPVEKKLNAKCC